MRRPGGLRVEGRGDLEDDGRDGDFALEAVCNLHPSVGISPDIPLSNKSKCVKGLGGNIQFADADREIAAKTSCRARRQQDCRHGVIGEQSPLERAYSKSA